MPNTLGKNLNLCFKKIRFPLASQPSSSQPLTPDDSRRLLTSATTTTASSTIFKNYNSLYDNTFDCSTSKSLTHSSSLSFDPEPESDSEPDLATVFASQRFFFTSPGSSNSIIESTPPSSIATTPESSDTVLASSSSINPIDNANESSNDGCCDRLSQEHIPPTTVENSVAVPTVSPNPYMDFRRSMQEMVEARDLIDVKANCEYLHELLLCYLALNPKSTHKFIIGAFSDLLVSLMAAEGGGGKIAEVTGGKINPEQCM
ncbi:RABIDOPSIS THALIANA OVATE FAMILY PROTEIN 16, ovate family protein 16 [Hibiscus trionum]|uniref:Transcription repressor n=1 Tax=Hibiscus trionum TaxID=183268 RepID=A0A9W7J6V1_HIBTR|nr:RABIDOPSIS THALIANA OVATE FAMILY PROTEIN 16, ovate family protein 16 [Hibiscus trionum]